MAYMKIMLLSSAKVEAWMLVHSAGRPWLHFLTRVGGDSRRNVLQVFTTVCW